MSISGHTSIGAAVGHSPEPDDPFSDELGVQTVTTTASVD